MYFIWLTFIVNIAPRKSAYEKKSIFTYPIGGIDYRVPTILCFRERLTTLETTGVKKKRI